MKIRRTLGLFSCLFLQLAPFCAASNPTVYQFYGKLLFGNGAPSFHDLKVNVILQGASTPFITQTHASLSGAFKFKNLQPGTYVLIAKHEHLGELKKTVEIGPSFADAGGKISASVEWDPKPMEQNVFTVSAVTLSTSKHARQLYRAALDLLSKHDVDGATRKLEEAVQDSPQFVSAWSYLGSIAYQSRQFKQAELCFREAFKLDPSSTLTLTNMGGVLLSEEKFEEALPFNLQAVRVGPDDALARSQLGLNYFRLGNESEAEVHLKAAKKSDPAHFSFPQLILSSIYKARNDYACMIGELEEFLRFHPDSNLADAVRVSLAVARNAQAELRLRN